MVRSRGCSLLLQKEANGPIGKRKRMILAASTSTLKRQTRSCCYSPRSGLSPFRRVIRFPFARSNTPDEVRHWPIITRNPARLVVSYETTSGRTQGSPSRKFLAQRSGGGRYHVGIDLYAQEGDLVRACEDGRVVAFYPFYTRQRTGEVTYALLIEHADFVVNYGEVKANLKREFGWEIGDRVRTGQSIARVSGTAMIHFETYRPGTRANQRWLPGRPRPQPLLNPTQYLLELTTAED